MEYFLQQLINGLTLGAIYGLVAIGYTMVYGIIGMINFAHGEIFMIGAFVSIITFMLLGLAGVTWVPLAIIWLVGPLLPRQANPNHKIPLIGSRFSPLDEGPRPPALWLGRWSSCPASPNPEPGSSAARSPWGWRTGC